MQLYEDDKLDLNAPLESYLPELPESWKKITVLQLLRQTSGLPDYRKHPGFDLYREWTYLE